MFLGFFDSLRRVGLEVTPTEWITLMEAMDKGLHNDSLEDFYYLSRSLLIKDVGKYDDFDVAFGHAFRHGALPDDLATKEQILDWLRDGLEALRLKEEEMREMERLSLDELLRQLEDRLKRQKGEHHGGHHWIGTGGTSPFGRNGSHPSGVSFSEEGGSGTAVLRAFARKYKNLRNDVVLDVRQMSVAMKKLRVLRQAGPEDVLDLDATIDKTCRNGGEIDLVFCRERENQVRLVLAMDTGGSMEPFRKLCERLFSAANGVNHFKEFKAYYFHNCPYDNLYEDVEAEREQPVDKLVRDHSGYDHRLIMVGDAAMAPYELMIPNGVLERLRASRIKGIDRLRQLARAYPKRVWLNPMREESWGHYDTVQTVAGLFPMYPLTVSGLERAVKELV